MQRLVATLLVALSFCATAADAPPKTLRYAFEAAETGFDPPQLSDLYSRIVTANLFDSLLRYSYLGKPGTLEPALAEALPEISPDFKVFTFHLKHGILFADDAAFQGKKRELVAADVVYSFKRVYDPRWKSSAEAGLEPYDVLGMAALRQAALHTGHFDYDSDVPGVRALDRYTVQFRLGASAPRFALNLADSSIFGVVAREVVEKYGDAIMEHPVGTGAFILAEWHRSSKMVFVRNPNFREEYYPTTDDPADDGAAALMKQFAGRRLPMIDRIEVSIIDESQPRWLSFLNRDQDYLERLPLDFAPQAIPNNRLAPNLAKRDIQMVRVPLIDTTMVTFNMDNPVVGGYTPEKVALRRAIGLALNVPELIRSLYNYQAFPAQSLIYPQVYGYDPMWHTEMGEYDLPRAKAILDEYGYVAHQGSRWRDNPDGTPLVIDLSSEPEQRSRVFDEIFKKSMDDLGVRVDFRYAKWPEQLKAAKAGTYMAWALGQSAASPDGGDTMQTGYGPAKGTQNLSRMDLPEFNELFLKQSALPDGPERLAVLRRMEELLNVYEPYKAAVHRYAIDMTYPWVKGYRRVPFERAFWKFVDIDQAQQARLAKGL